MQLRSTTVIFFLIYVPLSALAATSSNFTARSFTGFGNNETNGATTIRRQCWSKISTTSTNNTVGTSGGFFVYESSKEETIFLDMSHMSLDGSICLSKDDFLIVVEDEEEEEYDEYEEDDDWEEYEEYHDWDDVSTWPYWDRTRFREYYNCNGNFSSERPIPTEELWIKLRRTYANVVPYVQSSIYPMAPLVADDGFQFQVYAAQSPGKGRGIFANEFIPKDSLVYKSRWDGLFPDSHSYRQMLMELPADDLACQVMVWTYLQDLSFDDEDKNITLIANLDIGALVNGGGARTEDNLLLGYEWANVGCAPDVAQTVPGGCKMNDFALVDIYPGDEILSYYGEFVDQSWGEFGLKCDDCN